MLEYRKPDDTKEAIFQAELYIACKKAGLSCDLEYSVDPPEQYHDRDRCELDLVVIEGYQIIAIVETKPYSQFEHFSAFSIDQIKCYKHLGVPVFILYSKYDIPHLVRKLITIQKKHLKTINASRRKYIKNEKQSEDRWDKKIGTSIIAFNKTFPNYEFTNRYSLQLLATSVKALGLEQVLEVIGQYSEKKVDDFLFYLNSLTDYRIGSNKGSLRLYRKNSTVQTVLSHIHKIEKIDKKIN